VLLSLEEGRLLVHLARQSVEHYFRSGGRVLEPPANVPDKLREKRGVFVTINSVLDDQRELRGCIGFPYPIYSLVEATIKAALSSAFEDPRFPPLREDELDHVVFEVSVLTPMKKLEVKDPREYPKHIVIGRDGIVIRRGYSAGLLLPQVPVEEGWDAETFLVYGCLKAGLPPTAWLEPGTEVYTFSAQVFEEERPRGPVRIKEGVRCA